MSLRCSYLHLLKCYRAGVILPSQIRSEAGNYSSRHHRLLVFPLVATTEWAHPGSEGPLTTNIHSTVKEYKTSGFPPEIFKRTTSQTERSLPLIIFPVIVTPKILKDKSKKAENIKTATALLCSGGGG